jgi:RNA polymerase sigma-70 factor (ECF subfamily)
VGNPDDTVDDFEAWYERVHPRLVTSMLLLAGNLDLARDVVDEAFCRAFERWRRVARMASPDGWVYVVAVHELQRRRARRRKEQEIMRVGARPPEVSAAVASDFEALIDQLPLRQRTAVVLRHVGDLPEKEIAVAMGISRSTVSSTLRDAYSTLRRLLDDANERVSDERSA